MRNKQNRTEQKSMEERCQNIRNEIWNPFLVVPSFFRGIYFRFTYLRSNLHKRSIKETWKLHATITLPIIFLRYSCAGRGLHQAQDYLWSFFFQPCQFWSTLGFCQALCVVQQLGVISFFASDTALWFSVAGATII